MTNQLNLSEVYDKNINFLFGSGASFGLFPTLALKIKDETGQAQTIETLAARFEKNSENLRSTLLFMHYYKACIEPAMNFKVGATSADVKVRKVIENYRAFVETVLIVLQRKKDKKRCNVFTTNYDGCFAHIADEILRSGHVDFVINDGASGFQTRYIQAKNYNNFTYQAGVFERHHVDIPQINLIHLHGSVYWSKAGESIRVNYDADVTKGSALKGVGCPTLTAFSAMLEDDTKSVADLPLAATDPALTDESQRAFWTAYNSLPIVNPTKWKFHETVFEEQYYQMLRLLSYELEKPDTVFITFGFSFADEHILHLVKRSLSNPTLQLFVCCFDERERDRLNGHFSRYRNVELITTATNLDFSNFNKEVFSLNKVGDVNPSPELAK